MVLEIKQLRSNLICVNYESGFFQCYFPVELWVTLFSQLLLRFTFWFYRGLYKVLYKDKTLLAYLNLSNKNFFRYSNW